MPETWIVGLIIVPAILLFCFFVYRREREAAPSTVLNVLAVLRAVALLFLVFVFFRPTCVRVKYEWYKPVAAVLIDDSASMQRAEDYGEDDVGRELARLGGVGAPAELASVSRRELVQRALATSGFLEKLSQKHDVRLYAFDADIRPLETLQDLRASGQSTEIGEALRDILNSVRMPSGWSAILITDGRNNAGTDPLDAARGAVLEDVRLYTVGVGNPAEPNDIAIRDVKAPDVALVGDDVAVEVTVFSMGYDGETATLRLEDTRGGLELEAKSFQLTGRGQEQREILYFRPEREGEYLLRISVAAKSGELSTENNARSHHIRVEPEQIKVLYVEGYPRWEYRYLKNTLLRAANTRAQCLLLSASKEFIQESTEGVPALVAFPPRKDLFDYDVIIFGDVNPYQLESVASEEREAILQNIKEFVILGGGFLMIGGELDSPTSYVGTPIEDLLPVDVGERAEEMANRADRGPFRPRLENPFDPHEIVRLEKDLELNRRLWEDPETGLPLLEWYYPVRRAKPGAEVLLRHPVNRNTFGNHILAATTHFPSGRTMFLAIDSTWRWRKPYGDRYTERFWRSCIRYLALNKLKRLDKRFEVTTDKPRYDINERITIWARIRDADFNPATDEERSVKLQDPSGEERTLVLRKIEDGFYERTMPAAVPGIHRVWAEDETGRTPGQLSLVTFSVEVPRRELENYQLDSALLGQMATLTGGAYRRLDQIESLTAELKGEGFKKERGKEEEDVWDGFEWLLLFVGILGAEWIVRKKYNLV
ncbi:MAG: VWA domain-containing protein [Planctomycetota bacterium]